jgi:hypothetical protein
VCTQEKNKDLMKHFFITALARMLFLTSMLLSVGSMAADPQTCCAKNPPNGGFTFTVTTQRSGANPNTGFGPAIYRTNDHTAYISGVFAENEDIGSARGTLRYKLETWVILNSQGQLAEYDAYEPMSWQANATCHAGGGGGAAHVVLPEEWCCDPYKQTYYRGPVTLSSFQLEQWEYPASSGRPIFWVDKSICRPIMSIKGHPGSLDPTVADGFGITQVFANLTTQDTAPTLPKLAKACGGPGGQARPAPPAHMIMNEREARHRAMWEEVKEQLYPALGLKRVVAASAVVV